MIPLQNAEEVRERDHARRVIQLHVKLCGSVAITDMHVSHGIAQFVKILRIWFIRYERRNHIDHRTQGMTPHPPLQRGDIVRGGDDISY